MQFSSRHYRHVSIEFNTAIGIPIQSVECRHHLPTRRRRRSSVYVCTVLPIMLYSVYTHDHRLGWNRVEYEKSTDEYRAPL
jgi:hypothetical protein